MNCHPCDRKIPKNIGGPSRTRNHSQRATRAAMRAAMLPDGLLGENHLAKRDGLGPAGLEPATSWFVARRSIQLSYGRAGRGTESSITLRVRRIRHALVEPLVKQPLVARAAPRAAPRSSRADRGRRADRAASPPRRGRPATKTRSARAPATVTFAAATQRRLKNRISRAARGRRGRRRCGACAGSSSRPSTARARPARPNRPRPTARRR